MSNHRSENIPDVIYAPHYLTETNSDQLYAHCYQALDWQQESIVMFGRQVRQPRYQVWMGDSGAAYRYSGTLFQPEPWDAEVQALCRRLCRDYGVTLNSVLCNLYEDGAHGMGWHADNEPELGPQPTVVSVSLGSARRFVLKNRWEPSLKVEYVLGQGDLLIMQGDTQANWLHAVPKTRRPVGPRINLTFRQVNSDQ